jgi:hypothetical protein
MRGAYAQDWPVPAIGARVAKQDEIPASAARMAGLAGASGWAVDAVYARGTRAGSPPKVVDLVAVRGVRGAQAFAAVWIDGKLDACLLWAPLRKVRNAELQTIIRENVPI